MAVDLTSYHQLRSELVARLVKKASDDPSFRSQLLQNPKATLEQELGVKFEPHCIFSVHEDSANSVHLVLPVNPQTLSDADKEILGEHLEAITGQMHASSQGTASAGKAPPKPPQVAGNLFVCV